MPSTANPPKPAPPGAASGAASAGTTAAGGGGGLALAYLVNQYPKVSHSFVRREIAALEALGHRVERLSIRPCPDDLVDPADRAERQRTRVVLGAGAAGLLGSTLLLALTAPRRWRGALGTALRMGRRSDRGVLRHLIYLAEACVCRRWLAASGTRHLHAHFGTNSATVAMLCRQLGGPPFSFTVHGPEEFDKPQALSLGDKVAASAFTVAISDFGRSQLYRWVAWEHWPKIQVVRCGVDAGFLAAEPAPVPDRPVLVCVGRLCEQKGQSLLLEAAARVLESGRQLQLVLVGDGPMRSHLEQLAARLGVAAQVRFDGWASADAVRASLLRARALVLPSFAEGLPVVLMEALAAGRPVITTRINGVPELVRDGESGWLVTAGSTDELVAAMAAALDATPDQLAQRAATGRRRVAERHDAAREAAVLARLIEAVEW